jgi:hypothetical protein
MGAIHRYRKTLLALALVFAFVAVVVPTCRMVGCSMGGAMSWGSGAGGPGIFGTCGGTYITTATASAAVPPTTLSLLLALMAAAVAVVALSAPPVVVERITVHSSDPPPPPQDPRGERLRI